MDCIVDVFDGFLCFVILYMGFFIFFSFDDMEEIVEMLNLVYLQVYDFWYVFFNCLISVVGELVFKMVEFQ